MKSDLTAARGEMALPVVTLHDYQVSMRKCIIGPWTLCLLLFMRIKYQVLIALVVASIK